MAKKPTTIKKQLTEKMKDSYMKKLRVLGGTSKTVKTGTRTDKAIANARAIGTKPGNKIMAVKPKPTAKPKTTTKPKMTPEDKAYSEFLKKYKGDVTKVPGFKNGKGTM